MQLKEVGPYVYRLVIYFEINGVNNTWTRMIEIDFAKVINASHEQHVRVISDINDIHISEIRIIFHAILFTKPFLRQSSSICPSKRIEFRLFSGSEVLFLTSHKFTINS